MGIKIPGIHVWGDVGGANRAPHILGFFIPERTTKPSQREGRGQEIQLEFWNDCGWYLNYLKDGYELSDRLIDLS